MHVFPQLRKLEQKYAGELAVVGVHSAKFPAEKETANLRKAVLRYELEHPVVNDKDFMVWQQYACRAWPTLMFIDPQGKVIGKHEGEIMFDSVDKLMGEMIEEFDKQGLLNHEPRVYKLEREKEWERPLSFPGNVLADAESGRLFIADSNHNRIVVSNLDGDVTEIIGSGKQELNDGGFSEASFYDPQGMDVDGDILYVADTKNHAIRKIDLANKTVETIAGIGEQSMYFHQGGKGTMAAINSPWDVTLHEGYLYIAMAGFHQLWKLELSSLEVSPHAGSGRENIIDGPLQEAQLAQPSGIVNDGEKLYFTDSETSAIRWADIKRTGRVTTIVGTDLFAFGDMDGTAENVRLQHPIGIELHDGDLFIADTYNHKIKKVYPQSRGATAFLGTGQPGQVDGPSSQVQFHEPAGLSIAEGKLYIADTNNNAIRVADLETLAVTTLELKGI